MNDSNNPLRSGHNLPAQQADLVNLDDDATIARAAGSGASQDSMADMAHDFENQLEQMSAWKHQLAQQMELLRRDGIKLLERQKNIAIEKKRLAEEREAITADRAAVQKRHGELDAERQSLELRAAELEKATESLLKLQSEREKWLADLASAKASLQEVESHRQAAQAELASAQAEATELRKLEAQRNAWLDQVETAKAKLAELEAAMASLHQQKHALELRAAELTAREKGLAEQESAFLSQQIATREMTEQLEAQRKTLLARQHEVDAERTALAAKTAELERTTAAQREQLENDFAAKLASAEAAVAQRTAALEAKLTAAEQALADRRAALEADFAEKFAAAAASAATLESEKTALAKAKSDLQRRLDDAEAEHAEQLEMLAKQTKRLTERRAELEAHANELTKQIDEKVAAATAAVKAELARQAQDFEKRIAALQGELTAARETASTTSGNESALKAELAAAQARITQLAALEKELPATLAAKAAVEQQLAAAEAQKSDLEKQLAGVATLQADIAALQQQLSDVQASRAELEKRLTVAEASQGEAGANARRELELAVAREKAIAEERVAQLIVEVGTYKKRAGKGETLEAELAATKARLEATEKEVGDELAKRDVLIAELQTKLQAAEDAAEASAAEAHTARHMLTQAEAAATAATPAPANDAELADLRKQLEQLMAQRSEMTLQLVAIQDEAQRRIDDATLARTALEAQNIELRQQLEAAQDRQATPAPVTEASPASLANTSRQRDRLMRQARNLRAYRKQVRESMATMGQNREELAAEREQLKLRRESLEQVKRLLEKQEMVMARKLADHNALKTVAAVGIFVIMILGGVFLGVYKFVNPLYRSEAVVQLAPPANLPAPELNAWLTRQGEALRTGDIPLAAWKILRSPDEKYAGHDSRDEFIASLRQQLAVQVDAGSKTLAVRYTGNYAEGVAQVCNALATAYTSPGLRDAGDKNIGAGAAVLAKAVTPMSPAEDNRLMISLSVVAIVLFISLLLVILARHYVARQLREIDRMADEAELEDIKDEMPADAKPAV